MDSWFVCKNVYLNIGVFNNSQDRKQTKPLFQTGSCLYQDILALLNYIYMCFYHWCHHAYIHKENRIKIITGNTWLDSEDVDFNQRSKVISKSFPNTTELLTMHRITFISTAIFLEINPFIFICLFHRCIILK